MPPMLSKLPGRESPLGMAAKAVKSSGFTGFLHVLAPDRETLQMLSNLQVRGLNLESVVGDD